MNSVLAIAVNNLSKVYKSSSDTDKLALDNICLLYTSDAADD